jgi:hypothetical protein
MGFQASNGLYEAIPHTAHVIFRFLQLSSRHPELDGLDRLS